MSSMHDDENPATDLPAWSEHADASLPNVEEVRLDSMKDVHMEPAMYSPNDDDNDRNDHDGNDDMDAPVQHTVKKDLGWIFYAACGTLVIVLVIATAFATQSKSGGSGDGGGGSALRNDNGPTLSPTSDSPDRDVQLVANYLVSQGVTDVEVFTSEVTNQYKAARWMALEDPGRSAIPSGDMDTPEGYDYVFRYVMALNWMAMNGDDWDMQNNFMSEYPVCEWNGPKGGVFCDSDNVPVSLELSDNSLGSTLPTENGKLTTLEEFIMQANDLTGFIPTEICQMTNLKKFAVDDNFLSGNLPDCIGELSHLEKFTLLRNYMEGPIPHSAICSLSNLEWLFLADNDFEGEFSDCYNALTGLKKLYISNTKLGGPFPDLSGLSQLEEIYIDYNGFTGDAQLFNNFPQARKIVANNNYFSLDLNNFGTFELLEQLDFSKNSIISPNGIPTHLFSMPSLRILDLAHNQLNGTIPSEIPEDCGLEFIALYANTLSGEIPSQITNCAGLKHLDLSTNKFTGPIPEEIGSVLTNLHYLHMAENDFDAGPIPASFESLLGLEEFSLKRSNRNGTIPDFIGLFQDLHMLDLDDNNLEGEIPASLGNLEELQHILVSRNADLSGALPASFSNLDGLVNLFIDGTGVNGSIAFLCELPELPEDLESEREIYSDCLGDTARTECDCCECCDAALPEGCSQSNVVSLDLDWQHDYARPDDAFDFTVVRDNETTIERSDE